jgi:cupin 2 domain-containing protein
MTAILLKRSLFSGIPTALAEERFETWLETPGFRLERILSLGQVTAEGDWYDQDMDEWVALLQGGARLMIEGQAREIDLRPGDAILLPAHCRHRVTWTDPYQITVWLALHFQTRPESLTPPAPPLESPPPHP